MIGTIGKTCFFSPASVKLGILVRDIDDKYFLRMDERHGEIVYYPEETLPQSLQNTAEGRRTTTDGSQAGIGVVYYDTLERELDRAVHAIRERFPLLTPKPNLFLWERFPS